jgi:hypothetical protein
VYCNGRETCVAGACQPGTPVACNDGASCTDDMCSEAAGACTFVQRDADDDGHGDPDCGGDDCDDADGMRYPGATEVCDAMHDEDCNGSTVGVRDEDGDTYSDEACCNLIDGFSTCASDCDDSRPTVHPDEAEMCNGRDDDCNGTIDDGVQVTFYRDVDGDDYGRTDDTTLACSAPDGYSVLSGDCDETRGSVHPGTTDGPIVNCNMLDDDCDGTVDNGCSCAEGATRPCGEPDGMGGFTDRGECAIGVQRCVGGVWAECVGGIRSTAEVCDGEDDDCDGNLDDGVDVTCYADGDGDRHAPSSAMPTSQCPVDSRPEFLRCPAGFTGRAPAAGMADCNDASDSVFPGADEVCNAIDDDCDGMINEGVGDLFYRDMDADTYGDPMSSVRACTMPMNYVRNNQDCDDTRADVSPDDPEVCDTPPGRDEDCDDTRNEDCICTSGTMEVCGRLGPLPCHTGMRACTGGMWGTCMGNVDPTTETCNGVDDDCDGTVDDGVGTMLWRDFDGDGYGDPAMMRLSCMSIGGWVANDDDCNDMNGSIRPLVPERCDGIDGDCDGIDDVMDVGMAACDLPHTYYDDPFAPYCEVWGDGSYVCDVWCDAGWRDCNELSARHGADADGCETMLGTATDCTTCGDRCSSSQVCCSDGEPPGCSFDGCRSCAGAGAPCGGFGDRPCCAGRTCSGGVCSS